MDKTKQIYFDAAFKAELDSMVLNPDGYTLESIDKKLKKVNDEINELIIQEGVLELIRKNKKVEQLREFVKKNPEDARVQFLSAGAIFKKDIKLKDWKLAIADILKEVNNG